MLRAGGGVWGKRGGAGLEEEEIEVNEEVEEETELEEDAEELARARSAAIAAFSFSSISLSEPMMERKLGRASGSSAQHAVMSARHGGGVVMERGGR